MLGLIIISYQLFTKLFISHTLKWSSTKVVHALASSQMFCALVIKVEQSRYNNLQVPRQKANLYSCLNAMYFLKLTNYRVCKV